MRPAINLIRKGVFYGGRAKVQEYFEAAELVEQYVAMTEQMYDQLRSSLELAGDTAGAKATNIQKKIYAVVRDRVFDFVYGTYEDLLTNEEVDQLIEMERLPIVKKMRELTPEIQNRIIGFVMSAYKELEKEIERIIHSELIGADILQKTFPQKTNLPN